MSKTAGEVWDRSLGLDKYYCTGRDFQMTSTLYAQAKNYVFLV